MPVRDETLVRLETLAQQVSRLVDHRVEPLQIAALLIERGLEQVTDDKLAESIAETERQR
jgi:hypothetical protein